MDRPESQVDVLPRGSLATQNNLCHRWTLTDIKQVRRIRLSGASARESRRAENHETGDSREREGDNVATVHVLPKKACGIFGGVSSSVPGITNHAQQQKRGGCSATVCQQFTQRHSAFIETLTPLTLSGRFSRRIANVKKPVLSRWRCGSALFRVGTYVIRLSEAIRLLVSPFFVLAM